MAWPDPGRNPPDPGRPLCGLDLRGWDPLADERDHAPDEADRPFHRLPVLWLQLLEFEQLQLGEQGGQRVVEGVLQTLLAGMIFHWSPRCRGRGGRDKLP
jgi:hypothetical protein